MRREERRGEERGEGRKKRIGEGKGIKRRGVEWGGKMGEGGQEESREEGYRSRPIQRKAVLRFWIF